MSDASPAPTPDQPPPVLQAAAFPVALKALATLAMSAGTAGLALLWRQPDSALPASLIGLFVAAWAAVAGGWWSIVAGRTSFDGHTLRQTGLWNREVAVAAVRNCRVVHWPALDRLIAPRLVVRSGSFGVSVFHCADARVLRAFDAQVRAGLRPVPT